MFIWAREEVPTSWTVGYRTIRPQRGVTDWWMGEGGCTLGEPETGANIIHTIVSEDCTRNTHVIVWISCFYVVCKGLCLGDINIFNPTSLLKSPVVLRKLKRNRARSGWTLWGDGRRGGRCTGPEVRPE